MLDRVSPEALETSTRYGSRWTQWEQDWEEGQQRQRGDARPKKYSPAHGARTAEYRTKNVERRSTGLSQPPANADGTGVCGSMRLGSRENLHHGSEKLFHVVADLGEDGLSVSCGGFANASDDG